MPEMKMTDRELIEILLNQGVGSFRLRIWNPEKGADILVVDVVDRFSAALDRLEELEARVK